MIYIFIYIYLLALVFYSIRYKQSGYIQATILLIVVASLRYGTGTDFYTYQKIWEGMSTFNFGFDFRYGYLEPGFVLLSSLLKLVYSGDVIFFSVYAILTLGILSYALYRLKLNIVAGLLLYFCFFYFVYAFNGMRQAMAMSIFIYSLVYLKEDNQIRYYLINIVGLLFHYSAIVYLVLGFVLFLKLSKYQFIICVFFILLGGILAYFTNLFEIVVKFIFSTFRDGKIETYFKDFEGKTAISTFLPRLILFGWVLVLTVKLTADRMLIALVLFYTVGFAIYISLLDFNYLNARINMLFRITDIVIALIFIEKVNLTYNKFFLYSLFLAIYTSYFVNNLLNPDNIYVLRSSF